MPAPETTARDTGTDLAEGGDRSIMKARKDRSTGTSPHSGTTGGRRRVVRTWDEEFSRVRLRALFAIPLLALFLLVGGRAEACPLTNPNCAVDQASETVKETVDPAPDPDEVTNDVTKTVEDTVNTVDETVADTTNKVTETVNETLNPGGGSTDTPPPPEEPKDPGRRGDEDLETKIKSEESVRGPRGSDGRAASESGLDRSLRPDGDPVLGAGSLSAASSEANVAADEGLAESALEAAKDFAFPLLLTVLVGIFLAIQHRFDRRDPKLALAPVVHDYLSFE